MEIILNRLSLSEIGPEQLLKMSNDSPLPNTTRVSLESFIQS